MNGPTTFSVRAATAHDLDALAGLVAAFRDHLGQSRPDGASIADSLRCLARNPDTQLLLAVDADGERLGYAALRFRFSLWVGGIEAQLDDLFVAATSRRSGVGRALVQAAVDAARARGAKIVGLNTNERNADALRLYEASGFRAERTRWGGGRQLWLERET